MVVYSSSPERKDCCGFYTSPATARPSSVDQKPGGMWRQSNHVALVYGSLTFEERLAPFDASGAFSDRQIFLGRDGFSCVWRNSQHSRVRPTVVTKGLLTAFYTGNQPAEMCTECVGWKPDPLRTLRGKVDGDT